MSAWLDKDILRQSKKHPAFVVIPKALLINHADMDVRAPSYSIIFSKTISGRLFIKQMAIRIVIAVKNFPYPSHLRSLSFLYSGKKFCHIV